MSRWFSVLMGVCVVALATAAPAVAAPAGSVTATGTGQTRVRPADRDSNASIVAAFDAARKASIKGAIGEAHEYALMYAAAAGLTLGPAVSVSDQQNGGGFYYGPGFAGFIGPFGPNQFCGTVGQAIFKVVGGRRRVVATKKVHRCDVPAFAYVTLSVTYSAM